MSKREPDTNVDGKGPDVNLEEVLTSLVGRTADRNDGLLLMLDDPTSGDGTILS